MGALQGSSLGRPANVSRSKLSLLVSDINGGISAEGSSRAAFTLERVFAKACAKLPGSQLLPLEVLMTCRSRYLHVSCWSEGVSLVHLRAA